MIADFPEYSADRIGEDRLALYTGRERWFTLPVRSAVDADGRADVDDPFLKTECEADGRNVCLRFYTKSNLWAEKCYEVTLKAEGILYRIRVRGEGRLDAIRFFSQGVQYESSGYLLPIAGHAEETRSLRLMHEESAIGLGYFAPPPYVLPFHMAECPEWFGLGLAAIPGQYNFDTLKYKPAGNRFTLELPLYRQTRVFGVWDSQGLWGAPGRDAGEVLRKYAQWHYREGGCTRPEPNAPDWWRGPIFCGWGEQNTLARRMGASPGDVATQEIYTRMSERLDALGLHPRILIIDDKWQETYGEALPDTRKWPDLRAFVDCEHAKGRKVLLWFRSWNNEGLGHEECAQLLCAPCGADPTHPAYQARIHSLMRKLLSSEPDCFDCDGLKVDFANCMPLGEHIRVHEDGVYGIELLKRYMELLYRSAKAVKPDALINASCCHPYFADVCDQVRLHDYRGEMRSGVEVMAYRQKIVATTLPGALIDTDSGGVGSRRDFLRYLRAQPSLGIPDLYWLSDTEEVRMDHALMSELREIWAEYMAKTHEAD